MPETRTDAKGAPHGKAGTAPPEPEERRPVCTVAFCPICMAVTAGQGAAPDVIDHLLAAAREFFLAARAVIDVRGDQVSSEQSPNGSKGSTGFERIEIS